MVKIWLDWSDGRYSARRLTDVEAIEEDLNESVAYVEDTIWESYLHHCDRDATWQVMWRSISNEQSMRRRGRKLIPLEDAQHEINRLKEALARSERIIGDRHREDYEEFSCVYPQPGCQIAALPEEWREDAQEILDRYCPNRMEDGLKYQGCCCGHQHKLLADTVAQQLRDAGFLVENDSAR